MGFLPLTCGSRRDRDIAVESRPMQAARCAVEVSRRYLSLGLARRRHNQWLLTRRTLRAAPGKLWLDLELHAAVGTGEGDHGDSWAREEDNVDFDPLWSLVEWKQESRCESTQARKGKVPATDIRPKSNTNAFLLPYPPINKI